MICSREGGVPSLCSEAFARRYNVPCRRCRGRARVGCLHYVAKHLPEGTMCHVGDVGRA